MPTVAELERLRALIERLTPLTSVQRGELIRAQDWNQVVDAVLEVARAALAEGEHHASVPVHEHPDQVKISWLEPALRALIERGPLSDPAAAGKLEDLGRRAARLSDLLTKVEENARETRTRVADVAARDLARQSEITAVRRTVEAIDARRDDMQALRASLDSIRADVQTAVDVASRLRIDDEPVDMSVIDQRIRSVEELRARLQLPTGELLDAQRLETRLTDLTNTLVTQEQLDQVLRERPVEVPDAAVADLQNSLQETLRRELEGVVNGRLGEFRTEVNTRLGQIDATVARAVADAAPGIRDEALAAIRPEITNAVTTAIEEFEAASDTRLNNAIDAVRTELTSGLNEVRSSVAGLAAAEVNRLLPVQLDLIRKNITALQQLTTSLDQRVTVQEAELKNVATRIEVISRGEAVARDDLRRSLIAEMDTRDQAQARSFDRQLSELDAAIRQRTDIAINDARRSITEQVQQAAAEAAAAEVRVQATRLRAEMVSIAADQVAAVQTDLQAMVRSSVSEAMKGVPGIVSQEVRLATSNIPQLIKTEVTALQPTIRTMVNTELTNRVVTPRSIRRPIP